MPEADIEGREARVPRPAVGDGREPPRVVIRADGGRELGMGHLARTLSLAGELRRRGWEIFLASVDLPSATRRGVMELGGRVIDLPAGADDAGEIDEIERAAGSGVECVVLDHYGRGASWLEAAARITRRRAVVDDLADRPVPAELVIAPNPALRAGDYAALAPTARVLAGPRYALLRPEFAAAHDAAGNRQFGPLAHVLIALGGSDPAGRSGWLTSAVLEALPDAGVDLIVGPLTPLPSVAADRGRVRIHRDVTDVTPFMLSADLALLAGGGMSLEACCCGLPSLLVTVADNQVRQATALQALSSARHLGPLDSLGSRELEDAIEAARDAGTRQSMSASGRRLVDGRGAVRVADHIEGVALRPAVAADSETIWRLVNDPEARRQSFSADPIPWPVHEQWFGARLMDPSHEILVAENGAGPIGYVRLDRRNDEWIVSVAVDRDHRGGTGSMILSEAAARWRMSGRGGALVAEIKPENGQSLRAFEAAGFVRREETSAIVTMEWRPQKPPVERGGA